MCDGYIMGVYMKGIYSLLVCKYILITNIYILRNIYRKRNKLKYITLLH